jgi:hypothetical protein
MPARQQIRDGNKLNFKWSLYLEPGSYLLYTNYQSNKNYTLDMSDPGNPVTSFVVPDVSTTRDMHIILEVTDNGMPALTRYKRIIVNIIP